MHDTEQARKLIERGEIPLWVFDAVAVAMRREQIPHWIIAALAQRYSEIDVEASSLAGEIMLTPEALRGPGVPVYSAGEVARQALERVETRSADVEPIGETPEDDTDERPTEIMRRLECEDELGVTYGDALRAFRRGDLSLNTPFVMRRGRMAVAARWNLDAAGRLELQTEPESIRESVGAVLDWIDDNAASEGAA